MTKPTSEPSDSGVVRELEAARQRVRPLVNEALAANTYTGKPAMALDQQQTFTALVNENNALREENARLKSVASPTEPQEAAPSFPSEQERQAYASVCEKCGSLAVLVGRCWRCNPAPPPSEQAPAMKPNVRGISYAGCSAIELVGHFESLVGGFGGGETEAYEEVRLCRREVVKRLQVAEGSAAILDAISEIVSYARTPEKASGLVQWLRKLPR